MKTFDLAVVIPLIKTGRNADEACRDHGHIAHAVIGGPGGTAKALCGTQPGIRARWSGNRAAEITCVKCNERIARLVKNWH
jgi:hypothetical protein